MPLSVDVTLHGRPAFVDSQKINKGIYIFDISL